MKITLPRIIRVDLARKLVALFFAVMLWMFVTNQLHESEVYRDIPVSVEYNSNAMMVERDTLTVSVTLRGSRQRLQRVRGSDLKGTVKIPQVDKGVFFYDILLTPDNFTVPLGTNIAEIKPARESLAVDLIETKKSVPVRVRYNGKLRDDYKDTKCSVVPSFVDLRGPGKLLSEITELVTEPVPLDETITHGFEMDVKLVSIFSVVPTADKVHIQVEVARQTISQAYRDLPLQVLGAAGGSLEIADPLPPVSVTLEGTRPVMESLDASAVRPFVDLAGVVAPGRHRRPVQVWVGGLANVSVGYVFPPMVEVVLVERAKLGTHTP